MKYIIHLIEPSKPTKKYLESYSALFKIVILSVDKINNYMMTLNQFLDNPNNIIYLVGDNNVTTLVKNKYFENNKRVVTLGTLENAAANFYQLKIKKQNEWYDIIIYLGVIFVIFVMMVIGINMYNPKLLELNKAGNPSISNFAKLK